MLWIRRSLARKRLAAEDAPLLVVDTDDWEGPGGWSDDPRLGYTRWQRWFFAWQERFGLSHADAWTVASPCLRERAIQFGAHPERVFVLPNGVEPDPVTLSAAEAHVGSRSVLLYTRFAGVCPADVAAVWLRVRQELPDARLTVAGRGLAGEEEALGRLPGVELKGWVQADQLADVLRSGDVALVLWADTPANRARSSAKVRQLMAAGLAIVGYAVGELPATLADSAVLVPVGDVDACAQAVVGLLKDPLRARELGAQARQRVLAHFTWDRLAGIALDAYAAAGL
jgi:glycosyltransferase involved in cell wall biosynthesis